MLQIRFLTFLINCGNKQHASAAPLNQIQPRDTALLTKLLEVATGIKVEGLTASTGTEESIELGCLKMTLKNGSESKTHKCLDALTQ